MPGLTITTDARPASASGQTSSPPEGPPMSPITPPLGPTQLPGSRAAELNTTTTTTAAAYNNIPDFALGQPLLTHTTQTDQVSIAPPPAPPIVDFDENPDVLALKSAISILQLQRARATTDMRALGRAKQAALADPEAFVADLAAGRVRMEGDPLFSGPGAAGASAESDEEEEEDDEDEAGADGPEQSPGSGAEPAEDGAEALPRPSRRSKTKRGPRGKQKDKASTSTANTDPPWRMLPKPQSVVRCPPINWAQYGVVGESLDKLHAEQVAAPTPGTPMVLGPGGTYEFRAGGEQGAAGGGDGGSEQPRQLVGVAAPYNPGKDKLEKKGKAGRR